MSLPEGLSSEEASHLGGGREGQESVSERCKVTYGDKEDIGSATLDARELLEPCTSLQWSRTGGENDAGVELD